MATRERRVDRGRRLARRALLGLGEELRDARLESGLSQRDVGRLVGRSHSQIGRIERGAVPLVPYETIAVVSAVLGRDLPLRAFPNGDPARDAGQLALLGRFRARLPPGLGWRHEVPLGTAGDRRAWDAVIDGHGWSIPVEAETRLHDIQALLRRIELKRRDGGVDRLILLVADTRHNRHILRMAKPVLVPAFPLAGRAAEAALAAGQSPLSSAIVIA